MLAPSVDDPSLANVGAFAALTSELSPPTEGSTLALVAALGADNSAGTVGADSEACSVDDLSVRSSVEDTPRSIGP